MILAINHMLLIWHSGEPLGTLIWPLKFYARYQEVAIQLYIKVTKLLWLCLILLEHYMRKKDFRSIHGVSFISEYLVAFKSSGIRVIE